MNKTYIKPEVLVAKVNIETVLSAVSGPGLSSSAANAQYGMDSRSRGSRSDEDFDELW